MDDLTIKRWLTMPMSNDSGTGDGYGDGDGSGDGYGFGSGDDSDSGNSYKINNKMIYYIDGIRTIITAIKGLVAKGFIVNDDLTLTKTYVVKDVENIYFAHGKSIKEAMKDLENKIFTDINVSEKIKIFLQKFKQDRKYKVSNFNEWHGKLTGSCKQGRDTFLRNNNLCLDDEITVKQFIELSENEYGKEVIKKIKEKIYL